MKIPMQSDNGATCLRMAPKAKAVTETLVSALTATYDALPGTKMQQEQQNAKGS